MPRLMPDYRPGQVLYLVPRLKTCPSAAYTHTRVKFSHWHAHGRAVVKVISRYARERVTITTHAVNLARRKPLPTSTPSARTRRDRHQPLILPPGWSQPELAARSWWNGPEDF